MTDNLQTLLKFKLNDNEKRAISLTNKAFLYPYLGSLGVGIFAGMNLVKHVKPKITAKVPNFVFYFGSLLISEGLGRYIGMQRAIQVLDSELPRESALRKELMLQGMKLTQYEPLNEPQNSSFRSETTVKPVRLNQYGDVIEED